MASHSAADSSTIPDRADGATRAQGQPARRNTATVLMAVAIVILLGQVAREERIAHQLKAEVSAAESKMEAQAAVLASNKLQGHRQELVAATQWLQDFYRSDEGLRRPDGLWDATTKQVDTEAIGTWILDVYLKARVSGMSDAEARQRIADAIRGSDEWRRAHAAPQTTAR